MGERSSEYDEGYEAGKLEGRLLSLEKFDERVADVLEKYGDRLYRLDRLVWIGFGILITLQALPHVGRLFNLVAPSKAAAAVEHCYPMEQFARAFTVMFPWAPQRVLAGADAKQYLQLFNSFPPQSVYKGDSLLFVVMRTPKVFMVPMVEGVGCRRIVIPKRLDRRIMGRIERSKI